MRYKIWLLILILWSCNGEQNSVAPLSDIENTDT